MRAMKKDAKGKKQPDTLKNLVNDESTDKWYTLSDKQRVESSNTANDVELIEKHAGSLWQKDIDEFNQRERKAGNNEIAFLNTILGRGTAADRVSAIQVLVQKSPIHSLSHVEALVNIAENKNIREASSAIAVLKEIFLNELLPPDRKLIPFSMRPVNEVKKKDKDETKKLILWKFESELKKLYERSINVLEKLTNGCVENICLRACQTSFELLVNHPEQEIALLTLLVNKLGHPNNKVASKSSWYLLKLCQKHPNMRLVIIKEVERLVFRKNISLRCQFHALSFFSQIRLRVGESDVSTALLRIYFGLFQEIVVGKGSNDKMLSLLLSAINRAFPYAKNEAENLKKEVDTLYKLVHKSNFSTALQTLKLLFKLLSANQGMSDRFYAAFYRKLFLVQGSSQESQLFSLLYLALKADIVENRVTAFIKRLLQLSLVRSAAFAAASLILVSKLIKERPSLLIIEKSHQEVDEYETKKIKEENSVHQNVNDKEVPIKDVINSLKDEDFDEEINNFCDETNVSSWIHRKNNAFHKNDHSYRPSVRNPLFAFADRSIASELELLSKFYHPSVAVFASNLLTNIHIGYDGDPLLDFTQMRFLDRFVYRNPKDKTKKVANAIHRKEYHPSGIKKLAVSSEEYIQKKRDEIPADERYLHRYITNSKKFKDESKSRMKKTKSVEDLIDWDETESVNSVEFDSLLDKLELDAKDEYFDVDFTKEFDVKRSKRFSVEKNKHKKLSSDNEEEDGYFADHKDESEHDEEDDDEEDDDEGNEYSDMSDMEDDDETAGSSSGRSDYRDDSDNEIDYELDLDDDAVASADRFGEMLEFDHSTDSKKRKSKAVKSGGFKRRRFRR